MSKEERIKLGKVLKEQYNPDGSSKEVSWMYQQKDVDSEAYLTGKKITELQDINLRDDYNRGTASAPLDVDSTLLERRGKMDLEAKLKEDPLELIKAKEIEQKRKLLENTAKLKKLEKVVKSNSSSANQKSQKKKKKHRKRSSSSSSSSSSSGDELLSQFMAIIEKKNSSKSDTQTDNKKRSNSSDSDASFKRKRDKGRINRDRSLSSRGRPSAQNFNQRSAKGDRNNASSPRRDYPRDRYRSRSPRDNRQYKSDYRDNRKRSRSPVNMNSRNQPSHQKDGNIIKHSQERKNPHEKPKKKMSAEEMARLREEMQSDAKLRDKEREQRVHSHRKQNELEDKELEKRAGKGAGFLRPMVMKHADNASVEENVKRRIHTNQRSYTDNNFTRK